MATAQDTPDSGDQLDPPPPAEYLAAIRDLVDAPIRSDAYIGPLPAPTGLAPYSHAVSLAVETMDEIEVAEGRLIVLHDPAFVAAWDGHWRIVIFGSCEIDDAMADDALLSDVAWSWLTERLSAHGCDFQALGGTVTTTASTRYGDLAGPPKVQELEIRASWTALSTHLGVHLTAFADFLATAAGLPPDGVSSLSHPRAPFTLS